MSRWKNRGLAALAACLLMGAMSCGGCGEEEPKPPPAKESAAKEDAGAKSAADAPEARRRSVFGLPLPPSVLSIQDNGDEVVVKTSMSLDEIAAFFESRLTDYEILRPADQVRAVGLRDFMPYIYAYPRGPRSFIVYAQVAKQEESESGSATASAGSSSKQASAAPKPKPINERKKGEPVLDRTSDGKLLAPGARWGEPYTPPPGSPLDQKHLRSNFGRPYGQWTLK